MASEGSQRCRRVMSLIVFRLCAAEPRPLMTHLAGFDPTQMPNFRGHTQPQRLRLRDSRRLQSGHRESYVGQVGSGSALEMPRLGIAPGTLRTRCRDSEASPPYGVVKLPNVF
jgi:hypothetical protein